VTAQHTPGPWSVTDNSWETSTVYGPDGETIAECQINSIATEDTQYEFEAIKEANARLIAAAPELLEALEAMASAFVGHDGERGKDETFLLAHAALAKATGAA
jgi:hypothetical protein